MPRPKFPKTHVWGGMTYRLEKGNIKKRKAIHLAAKIRNPPYALARVLALKYRKDKKKTSYGVYVKYRSSL